ncbi:MAG TPA: LCP family protein [Candidatus Sulfotelmatobacter sp.]|nr:LCP family protein [Candidatus Sulfotelmatobacter sp.]
MQGNKNGARRGSIDGFITPMDKPISKIRPSLNYVPPQSTPPEVAQPEPPKITRPLDLTLEVPSPKTKKKWTKKKKIILGAASFAGVIGILGIAYGAIIISSIDETLHGNIISDVHALTSSTTLKGEAQGRVNILLAGDSADDPNHQGANLTDSIMVLSIDPKNHTGFMLSIPRDLWVNIPNYGNAKINAANAVTNFNQPGLPSGGMGQLQQVVQDDLGIPIDYYSLLNYAAFKDAVDAVGQIKLDIQSPDPRGIYDAYTHTDLPNGWVSLNGQQALDLSRARGDESAGDISYGLPNGDFNRTQHQRQMLVALAQKAETIGILANPFKMSELFKSLTSNIQTNLNLADLIRLSQITDGMNLSKLQSVTYAYGGANSILTDYTAPDGEEALAPTEGVGEFGQLQQYYQQLTSNNPVAKESPSIVVLNGTQTDNLARGFSTKISTDGFNVEGITDANNTYSTSMIIDNVGNTKPDSLDLLRSLLPRDTLVSPNDTATTEATEAQGYNANFVVVLGQDYTGNPAP